MQQPRDRTDALGGLTSAPQTLAAERMTIKSPIRDPHILGVERNLSLSIRCIDRGRAVFNDTGWELENSKLGELMRAAGYQQVGADPGRHYVGQLPWYGSLPEVERRIADLAKKRQAAQAALDEALMADDERAKREAESAKLREAFNAMRVKVGADGLLVAYREDGDVFPTSEMTELQRQAFERVNATFWR
jgi:hypothetical protein